MKRITTIFAAILMTASVFLPQQASAQAPQKMSYQAVVRNSSDALITSTSVGMRISILQGAANGTAVYVETQTPTTNTNGLASLEIGSGIIVSGDFSTIDWANGPYFIRTETDPNGGANYTITGTSELLSVPYALFSANGTPGPQGIQGPQGPAGANGTNGTNGLDGNGITQTTDNGDGTFTFTYDDGSTFTASDLTGPQGATGAQGAQGIQGVAGTNGTNGAVGATGAQGPAGANGTNGTNGLDGNGIVSTVDNGDGTFTFTYDDGSTFTTSDLTGPQGATGAQGAQGIQGVAGTNGINGAVGATGAQGPAGANGTNGTNGLDGNGITQTTDNGDGTFTFTYDDDSTFTTSDLTGPQGATGAQGAQGIQGVAGTNGINGAVGATGAQGPVGANGTNGTNGTNGSDGNGIVSTVDNGDGTFTFTYDDGSTFTTSNLTGATGPQGPQGAQGIQGTTGLLPSGAVAGNTAYWNGSQWVVNGTNFYNNGSNLGVGTTSPDASALADLNSTTQGFLPPRMTTVQRDAILAPAAGLTIYNTTENCLQWWNGTIWYDGCGNNAPAQPQYPAGAIFCASGPTVIVDVTNPITGAIWMDRNLGAAQVATSSTDANSYGDLYQWGRRADGHQCRNSATTSTNSSSDQPGHGNFILEPNSPHDWRSPQNISLWQGVNGVNNPCPSGYRLPTDPELDAERLSWSQNNSAGAFASPLKLPMAGYRFGSNGSLNDVGTFGRYWSSAVSGTNSRYLGFDSSGASMYDSYRASGNSVRCLKD